MNTCFQRLLDQATTDALHATQYAQDYLGNPVARQQRELQLEKFAELIVRECSKVIVNGGYRNPALGEKHPLTPPEIAIMIKEHFGVEE
jgi:hypothetical protein